MNKIISINLIRLQAMIAILLILAIPGFASDKSEKDVIYADTAAFSRLYESGREQTFTQFLKLQEEAERNKKRGDNYLTALIVLTALYVFVYIMGRRRLMLKIWARNKDLIRARDKAEESDRMKSAFIRNMSHEIRTPLNAINGFSELLCSDYELGNEEREDLKQRISGSVNAITTIVNELLDISLGESQSVRKPTLCNEVGRNALEESRVKNKHNLDLRFSTDLPDDYAIVSNADNISRILSLLLDNALKFTTEGYVRLHCSKTADSVTFSVEDTGIGIPLDEREHIFEKFVKLDDYVDGVGLGLPVSRRLSELLGGKLSLDGQYHSGCRFVLSLPAK